MNDHRTTDSLCRLLRLLSRGLPSYLSESGFYSPPGVPEIGAALTNLSRDQEHYAALVADELQSRGVPPDPGPYPIHFGGINDADVVLLLPRIVEDQQRRVAELRGLVTDLSGVPELRSLADQVLGNALAHLRTLQQYESAAAEQ